MRTPEIAYPRPMHSRGALARRLGAALLAELGLLRAPALWVALGGLLLLLLLVPQLPLRYQIDVGYEEGVGSDLPFVQGFNTAERDELGSYRWTDDGALIELPAVGRRPLALSLEFLPTPAAVVDVAPRTIQLLAGGQPLATLPVRPGGDTLQLVVPPDALAGGTLRLTLRMETFGPPGDPRQLGLRLDRVGVVGLVSSGPVAPEWGALAGWLAAVAVGWLVIGRALGGFSRGGAWLFGLGVLMVGLAALLDPPRWAYGAGPALTAALLSYPLAAGARAWLPRLAARLGVPLPVPLLGWLALFVALSLALRYGGRLYPDSMHGDIGFHHNRLNEAVWGLIYIISVNRGVDFPYPPGPYLLLAPFSLLGLHPRTLLEFGAALLDALSAALVYAVAARVARPATALLAAGVYVFSAATFMTTWWSFDTHIYSQFLHLLTITALCWALDAWQGEDRARRRSWALAVFTLLCLVFLGHFGFLINTTLMVALAAALVWLLSWRGGGWARMVRWPLTLALGGAVLVAGLLFYSAYIPLFLGQLQVASAGGLSAVAERAPVSRAYLWRTLWQAGLITHFGLFPLLLLPAGMALLWREGRGEAGLSPRRAVLLLMACSLVVAVAFAGLPFITLATNSPRWLMFIAWAVAVGSAVAAERIWRAGWAGRLAVLAMGAVVLANTAWIWLSPMLWRVRPPEPF